MLPRFAHRILPVALGLASIFSMPAFAEPGGSLLSAPQVRSLLTKQGYTLVTDMELDHGVWEADATNAQGIRVDVFVDPRTGQVISDEPMHVLGASEIRKRLSAAGFRYVRDLELDDGVWKAEAFNAAGMPVDVMLDPHDGKILHVENELFD